MKRCRSISIWDSALLTVILLSFCISAIAGDCCRFRTNKKPVWERTLVLPALDQQPTCNWDSDWSVYPSFIGPDRLVVAMHFFCSAPPETWTRFRDSVRSTFDVLFLIDSHTGKTLKGISWKDLSKDRVRGDAIQIFSVAGNKVLIRVGAFVKLLSEDLEELHSRFLPVTGNGDEGELWNAEISPSGRIGLLRHWRIARDDRTPSDLHWFSPETLEDISVEYRPTYSLFIAVSDDKIFYSPQSTLSPAEFSVAGPVEAAAASVHVHTRGIEPDHLLCERCLGVPLQVLPDGLLLLSTDPGASFWLIDATGNIVYRGTFGIPVDDANDVTIAAEGNRFSFKYGHLGNGIFNMGAVNTVVVFDLNKMKSIFKLKVKEEAEKGSHGGYWPGIRIALSPSGTQLIVGDGTTLKLFSIGE